MSYMTRSTPPTFPSIRKFFAIRYNQIWTCSNMSSSSKDSPRLRAIDPNKMSDSKQLFIEDNEIFDIEFNMAKNAAFVLDNKRELKIFGGLQKQTSAINGQVLRAQWSTRVSNLLFILDSFQCLYICDIQKNIFLFEPIQRVQTFYIFPRQVDTFYFVIIQKGPGPFDKHFLHFFGFDNLSTPIYSIEVPVENVKYDIIADYRSLYLGTENSQIYEVQLDQITPQFKFRNSHLLFGEAESSIPPNSTFAGFLENHAIFAAFEIKQSKHRFYRFYFLKNHYYSIFPNDTYKTKCISFEPTVFVTYDDKDHKKTYTKYLTETNLKTVDKNGKVKEEPNDISKVFSQQIEESLSERIELLTFRGTFLEQRQKEFDRKSQVFQHYITDLNEQEINKLKEKFNQLQDRVKRISPINDYDQLFNDVNVALAQCNKCLDEKTPEKDSSKK